MIPRSDQDNVKNEKNQLRRKVDGCSGGWCYDLTLFFFFFILSIHILPCAALLRIESCLIYERPMHVSDTCFNTE